MLVSFRPNAKVPFHSDIFFDLEGLHLVADSYYFELDHPVTAPGGIDAALESLKALLRQWLARLSSQAPGSTLILPFDYSDQYTGVLLVTRDAGSLAVSTGSTTVEGWAHFPSDIADFDERVRECVPTQSDDVVVHTSREWFIAAVERSLAAIGTEQ